MGLGQHSCCNKQKVKRGLWSPEEDEKLINYISTYGHGCWSSVPRLAGLQRCGKSCRLRWINYLRPDLKRGGFSPEEALLIVKLHRILGNRWSQIAKQLPGRTDNEVKNFWNSSIKKKLLSHHHFSDHRRHHHHHPNHPNPNLFPPASSSAVNGENQGFFAANPNHNLFNIPSVPQQNNIHEQLYQTPPMNLQPFNFDHHYNFNQAVPIMPPVPPTILNFDHHSWPLNNSYDLLQQQINLKNDNEINNYQYYMFDHQHGQHHDDDDDHPWMVPHQMINNNNEFITIPSNFNSAEVEAPNFSVSSNIPTGVYSSHDLHLSPNQMSSYIEDIMSAALPSSNSSMSMSSSSSSPSSSLSPLSFVVNNNNTCTFPSSIWDP